MANTLGATAENTKVNGSTISWMATVFVNIKTVECITACIKIIRSTGMASMFGLMDESTMENGQMVFSMDQGNK